MKRNFKPVDPIAGLRLHLVVIPDNRLAQDPAEESLANIANQVTPLGPVSPGEKCEMNMPPPKVQPPGERMIPVVLDAGDRLKSQVVKSNNDQGADVHQG